MLKEIEALEGKYNGCTAKTKYGKDYTVVGWYMNSNGCLKTHGNGYEESFIVDTAYEM